MTFRWITRGPQLSLRTVIGGVDLAGIVAKCVNLILRQRDFRLQLACEVASCRCRTKGCELHFSHRKSVRFHGHMDSETGPRGKEEGNYAFGDRSASIHVEIVIRRAKLALTQFWCSLSSFRSDKPRPQ